MSDTRTGQQIPLRTCTYCGRKEATTELRSCVGCVVPPLFAKEKP